MTDAHGRLNHRAGANASGPLRKEDEVEHPMTDELRNKTRALGLDRLTDEHLEQFERATTDMERHLKRLPRDMPPAQEPAHVYRAKRQTP